MTYAELRKITLDVITIYRDIKAGKRPPPPALMPQEALRVTVLNIGTGALLSLSSVMNKLQACVLGLAFQLNNRAEDIIGDHRPNRPRN